MSFISCSWDSGVFALRFDLSRWFKAKPKKKATKLKGAKPLPPPFPLPPLKAAAQEELLDAPALDSPSPAEEVTCSSPSVIVDVGLAAAPEPTVLLVTDDDLTNAPADAPTRQLRAQRREVRKTLAGARR